MNQRASQRMQAFVIAVVAGLIGLGVWNFRQKPMGVRNAEGPLEMPGSGEVDFRFLQMSPWQTVTIPRALKFDSPMGTETGALVYNAQKFWEMNEKRGGHHTGDDLNGIGGMNTDLGDPVYATADGLVIYTGEPSPGWGKIIVIAHKTPDGNSFHSMYAHLERIDVRLGGLVARGSKIGAVGTANGYYPAHLHFEMRASDGVDIGAGYGMLPLNRLDPQAWIDSTKNTSPSEITSSPLAWMLEKSGGRDRPPGGPQE
ncbi:MAG: M23 family metallopeptidase [Gloeobacteraceae cyanobacterium ES-bin-144]|nr:M23 family metallopeptidase [Verrucomicrobiales bacterium]